MESAEIKEETSKNQQSEKGYSRKKIMENRTHSCVGAAVKASNKNMENRTSSCAGAAVKASNKNMENRTSSCASAAFKASREMKSKNFKKRTRKSKSLPQENPMSVLACDSTTSYDTGRNEDKKLNSSNGDVASFLINTTNLGQNPELLWPTGMKLEFLDEGQEEEKLNRHCGECYSANSESTGEPPKLFALYKFLHRVWQVIKLGRPKAGGPTATIYYKRKRQIYLALQRFKKKHKISKERFIKTIACADGIESDSDSWYTKSDEIFYFDNPNYVEIMISWSQ